VNLIKLGRHLQNKTNKQTNKINNNIDRNNCRQPDTGKCHKNKNKTKNKNISKIEICRKCTCLIFDCGSKMHADTHYKLTKITESTLALYTVIQKKFI